MKVVLVDLGDPGVPRLERALRARGYAVHRVTGLPEAVWLCHEASGEGAWAGGGVVVVCLPGAASPAPVGDGRAAALRLREAGVRTPLLVVAGTAGTDDVVAALDAGADDVVARPVRLAEVVARVRALSRRDVPPAPVVLEVGDLVLDPGSHTVTRAGHAVELSPQLFGLLEVFARHPGQVLTRDLLLEAVWDPAQEARSNVVDQAVAALRRRIDRPYGRRSLQTVRGRGYRLDPAV